MWTEQRNVQAHGNVIIRESRRKIPLVQNVTTSAGSQTCMSTVTGVAAMISGQGK